LVPVIPREMSRACRMESIIRGGVGVSGYILHAICVNG
jgi:hypothetical protein